MTLYFLILFSSFLSNCQLYEFEDEDLVNSPFDMGEQVAGQLIENLSNQFEILIDTTIYMNRHVDNTFDTSYLLTIKNSRIEIFANASEFWINKTELNDSLLILKNGLSIGSKRNDFLSKFEKIGLEYSQCDSYRITGLDAVCWLDIYFTNDIISQIYYSGYND